jgi:hypothetical protein
MKKLMIVGVLVFAFAFTLNMAFADNRCNSCDRDHNDCPTTTTCGCPSITVSNTNSNAVNNTISSIAVTGKNTINVPQVENYSWLGHSTTGTGTIWSGNATALVSLQNTVGQSETRITSTLPITVTNYNTATVSNTVKAFAGTGNNTIKGAGTIGSGAGLSQIQLVNLVGTHYTEIK